MQRIHVSGQKPVSLFLTVSLALLLVFVLAACGSNGGIGSSVGSTATPQPTLAQGHGTDNGCPDNTMVTTAPTANVTVKLADAHSPVVVHVGDMIEIQLPFGLRWTSPTASGGALHLHGIGRYHAYRIVSIGQHRGAGT